MILRVNRECTVRDFDDDPCSPRLTLRQTYTNSSKSDRQDHAPLHYGKSSRRKNVRHLSCLTFLRTLNSSFQFSDRSQLIERDGSRADCEYLYKFAFPRLKRYKCYRESLFYSVRTRAVYDSLAYLNFVQKSGAVFSHEVRTGEIERATV